MKFVSIELSKNNFGDDLNGWLWPKLFSGIHSNEEIYLLGIGTILLHDSPGLNKLLHSRKIVFGSGVRPSETYHLFKPDPLMEIKFLRGPLSAQVLDNKYEFITDAAYAMRQWNGFHNLKETKKEYEISVMPYFLSVDYFDWEAICRQLGYHYISPCSEKGVEFTLREIAASKLLITEAMHGAIAADILRVPWHRFILTTPYTEGELVSEFKWRDWLQSVNIQNPEITFIPFYRKTRVHNWIKKITAGSIATQYLFKPYVKRQILQELASSKKYYLSGENLLSEIDQRIQDQIANMYRQFIQP